MPNDEEYQALKRDHMRLKRQLIKLCERLKEIEGHRVVNWRFGMATAQALRELVPDFDSVYDRKAKEVELDLQRRKVGDLADLYDQIIAELKNDHEH